jgi:hypothetical protein
MDTVDGCRHLREYKEEEGLDAYKTVHAWFATPVSAAARRSLVLIKNLLRVQIFATGIKKLIDLNFNASLPYNYGNVPVPLE